MQHYYDNWDWAAGWAQIASIVAIIGSMFGVLPYVAAGCASIYYMIQIWQSPTAQAGLLKWRERRMAARISVLRRKAIQLKQELKALGQPDGDPPASSPSA